MRIFTYRQQSVELIRTTHAPSALLNLAAEHCMKMPEEAKEHDRGVFLAKSLLKMHHTSPFEHVVYTFKINNFSRSGLAQLTRHRHASFTVSSQHYQDYSQYPFVVEKHNPIYEEAFQQALKYYDALLRAGTPRGEARQVLPNAMSCGLVMTINARSLVNFLNLRLCKRNCAEIMELAWNIKYLVTAHFPELFSFVHADCVMDKCSQGVMACGEPYAKA